MPPSPPPQGRRSGCRGNGGSRRSTSLARRAARPTGPHRPPNATAHCRGLRAQKIKRQHQTPASSVATGHGLPLWRGMAGRRGCECERCGGDGGSRRIAPPYLSPLSASSSEEPPPTTLIPTQNLPPCHVAESAGPASTITQQQHLGGTTKIKTISCLCVGRDLVTAGQGHSRRMGTCEPGEDRVTGARRSGG